MDSNILFKVLSFWVIFYITPGPVWVAVMEATRTQTWAETLRFFAKVFLRANILVQAAQALVSVLVVEWLTRMVGEIAIVFYLAGGSYMLYLAYKVLRSTQAPSAFELTFANLAMILLLSPKIWTLFPAGAVIANQLGLALWLNAIVFSLLMLLVSNSCFFLYAWLGKLGTKLLKDNFSYLAFGLLLLFAAFLFREAWLLV